MPSSSATLCCSLLVFSVLTLGEPAFAQPAAPTTAAESTPDPTRNHAGKPQVQRASTPAQATTPEFLPRSWKVEVYLFSPWSQPDHGRILPLTTAKTGSTVPNGQVLGYLTSARGDVIAVSRDQSQEGTGLPHGLSGLGLGFEGLSHAENYTGVLKLPQGNVTVSLKAAHHFIWAALAVAFGIFLGLLVQRYTGVLRGIWALEQREAELGTLFQQARRQFMQEAQGRNFSSYSIATDFENQRKDIRGKIDALRGLVVVQLDENNQRYKATVDQLQKLEEEARTFGTAVAQFAALGNSIAALDPRSARPPFLPEQQHAEPAFLVQARQLLPGTELTIADFQARLEAVAKNNVLVQGWPDLDEHAGRLWQESQELAQDLKDQIKAASAQTVSQTLGALWTRLWIAADYGLPEAHQELENAEETLLPLRPVAKPNGVPEIVAEGLKRTFSPEIFRAQRMGKTIPDDQTRASLYRSLRSRAEWGLLILAFFVALFQGLTRSYFGKPFGTVQSYLDLILWAAFTKGVLDLTVAGLQRLQNLRLPASQQS